MRYVAAEFRRAGLEPGGDDGYFQTASHTSVTHSPEGVYLTLEIGGRSLKIDPNSMRLNDAVAAEIRLASSRRNRRWPRT